MHDADGPKVAQTVYQTIFAADEIDEDTIARAVDVAVLQLRADNVPPERWATFVHIGV
jgi:hypothetical protein